MHKYAVPCSRTQSYVSVASCSISDRLSLANGIGSRVWLSSAHTPFEIWPKSFTPMDIMWAEMRLNEEASPLPPPPALIDERFEILLNEVKAFYVHTYLYTSSRHRAVIPPIQQQHHITSHFTIYNDMYYAMYRLRFYFLLWNCITLIFFSFLFSTKDNN